MKKLLACLLLTLGSAQAQAFKPAAWISPSVKVDKTAPAGIGISWILDNLSYSTNTAGPPSNSQIVALCRKAIIEASKTPSTIKFVVPQNQQPARYTLNDATYSYLVRFDGQNLHGANVRQLIMCLLAYSGDQKKGKVILGLYPF